MKLVKLSLVAALAAGAFSAANATSLEEAIKDVDLSGVLRYRYDTGNIDDKGYGFDANDRSAINKKQEHNFRAQVNFKASIADNFKAFVQLEYNNTDGGYNGASAVRNGNGGEVVNGGTSSTKGTIAVRQLYLEYNNADYATSIIAGKQQLNTIWTDNGIDGLVGTGVKVLNNSIDGLTIAAFAVDSYNAYDGESDVADFRPTLTHNNQNQTTTVSTMNNPFEHNLYGAALIGSYEALGGTINPQLWLAYINNTAFLYAVDVAYNTTIFGDMNWGLEAAYLGNSVDNDMKDITSATYDNTGALVGNPIVAKDVVGNGNFFALKGTLAAYGWDGSLGGVYYGDKDQITMTTLEDNGNVGHLFAGEELKYTDGSHLSGDIGRNIFGYVTLGYTFNETVRIGGDFVYGGTQTVDHSGGDKYELVARVDYKYSPKLSFQAWYSYVSVDGDYSVNGQNIDQSGSKDTIRLQALYKF